MFLEVLHIVCGPIQGITTRPSQQPLQKIQNSLQKKENVFFGIVASLVCLLHKHGFWRFPEDADDVGATPGGDQLPENQGDEADVKRW